MTMVDNGVALSEDGKGTFPLETSALRLRSATRQPAETLAIDASWLVGQPPNTIK